MESRLITAPTVEPVTLSDTKLHLRVDHSTEDALIQAMITAAREYCESYQNRAYLEQTRAVVLDAWPSRLELPRAPLMSVTHIKYYDTAGTEYTLDSSLYTVITAREPGVIRFTDFPSTELREEAGIVVAYKAGASTAAGVPDQVKQAILLLVGLYYENREAYAVGNVAGLTIPYSVDALLWMDRMW